MAHTQFESPGYVQRFLDSLGPDESFRVKFVKQDGTPRDLEDCRLDPNGTTRKHAVPVMTKDGWKSFLVDRVIWIGRDTQGNVTAKQGKDKG